MIRRIASPVARDERGVTIIEFAMILPVMLSLIMGLGELAYRCYVQAILTGAVQKAGRDSGIEGGAANTAAIDQLVINQVLKVAGSATFSPSTRLKYTDFASVGKPEPFTDSNNNGVYDVKTECFTDTNGDGVWDTDQGTGNTQGGANDVTLYTMTMSYPRLFPVAKLFGWSSRQTISATTILQNQPYATQSVATPLKVCPK